jgi:3-mercaptopyruvate sulfurtransferase SseA
VAQELIKMGFPHVYALKGGWIQWEKAKYPIEKK